MKQFLLVISVILGFVQVQAKEAYAIYNNGTLTLYYDNAKSSRNGTVYEVPNATCNLPQIPYASMLVYMGPIGHPWHEKRESTSIIVIDPSFADYRPTITYGWFTSFSVTEIRGLKSLNTSQVTNMRYMFAGCQYLTELDLSCFTITDDSKASNLCFSCLQLQKVTFGNTVTTIGTDAFCNCVVLSSLSIPNSVRNIGSGAFHNCYSLTTINSGIVSPYEIPSGAFYKDTKKNATLIVPNGTKALYETTDGWKEFQHISQSGTSRVESIPVDETSETMIYNLNGQQVKTPQKGILILRNGKNTIRVSR